MAAGKRMLNTLGIAVVIAAIIAIILVIVLIFGLLRGGTPGPGTTPPGGLPSAQSADCPDVEVLAVPGTWESSSRDDPWQPRFNRNSLILKVTRPLQADYPASRMLAWTTPYVAQFHNPVAIPPDGQATYDFSRVEGATRTSNKLAEVHKKCPLTSFILMGFSQGATIVGDLAGDIGHGRGPVPASSILGVALISDSRRDPTQVRNIGPNPEGVGIEALLKFNLMGVNLRGPRDGGFGELHAKTVSICAPHDPICDSPKGALNPFNAIGTASNWLGKLAKNSHALYATTRDWSLNGQSATVWVRGWARGLINNAPQPAHN